MRIKLGALAAYVVMMGFFAIPAKATLGPKPNVQGQICDQCYPQYGGSTYVFLYCQADGGPGIYTTTNGSGGDSCLNQQTGNRYSLNCECWLH